MNLAKLLNKILSEAKNTCSIYRNTKESLRRTSHLVVDFLISLEIQVRILDFALFEDVQVFLAPVVQVGVGLH